MSRPTAAPAHFPYAHRTLAETARDDRIVSEYVAGNTVYQLADQYGLSKSRIGQIVKAAGVSRKPGGYRGVGKPIAWRECPKHLLEDYRTLRNYMTAAEARETLEAHL